MLKHATAFLERQGTNAPAKDRPIIVPPVVASTPRQTAELAAASANLRPSPLSPDSASKGEQPTEASLVDIEVQRLCRIARNAELRQALRACGAAMLEDVAAAAAAAAAKPRKRRERQPPGEVSRSSARRKGEQPEFRPLSDGVLDCEAEDAPKALLSEAARVGGGADLHNSELGTSCHYCRQKVRPAAATLPARGV